MLRDYDPITAQLIAFVPRVVGAALTLLVGVVLLRLALPAAREGLKRAGIAQAAPFVMTAVTAAGWIVILSAAFQATSTGADVDGPSHFRWPHLSLSACC